MNHRANWWAEMPIGRTGTQRRPFGWVVLSLGFLVPLMVPAVSHLLSSDKPTWRVLLSLALLLVYGLGYVVFPIVMPPASRRVTFPFCVAMLVVGLLLYVLLGLNPYVIVYATGVVVVTLPAAWGALLSGSALLLCFVVLVTSGHFADDVGDLIAVASTTLTLFVISRLVYAVRALQSANEEIATLAVSNERERMARDLHDILGHSLTTIAVKAGLTRRVLESSADTERAITEIREVEGLARSALSDVRATVSEYREVSLAAELVGARVALRAAEITAELPAAVDNVDPGLQPIFGYVLREAVTNVLRHSGARRVKVRLGQTWMEIEDDGTANATSSAGNGLRGLEERLAQIGGTMNAASRPEGGFLVRADAPAKAAQ